MESRQRRSGSNTSATWDSARRSWMLDTRDTSVPYLFPPEATYCQSHVGSLCRTKITRKGVGHFGDTLPIHPLEAL